jgi:ABC-type Fe3+/spermidine/putrescine transport system ATPase subunit
LSTQPSQPLLRLEEVSRCFGDLQALAEVSLDLDDAGVLTVLGPSGCGKTTLLRVIAGLDRPDSGRIHIGGRAVNGSGLFRPPQERPLAMIFQELALWPHMTVSENISLGLRALGRTRDERRVTTEQMLERLEISATRKRYPHTLSAGQRQRVALARALVLEPRLLLMDEPFAHLDWPLRQELITLLGQLAPAMVFVTHDQLDALAMHGTLAIMRSGRIEQMGPATEVIANPATAFVGDFLSSLGKLVGKNMV